VSKVDGLVYTDTGSSEWQTFADFPSPNLPVADGKKRAGWPPGVPVPLEAIGLEKKEALARVKELGLPLTEAKADALDAGHFDSTGGMLSGATAVSETAAAAPPVQPEHPGDEATETES